LLEQLLIGSRFKNVVKGPEQHARQHKQYIQKGFVHLPSVSTVPRWPCDCLSL
jgi:hypothetical protein